ncbi:hypothetical protein U9M48_034544 [Paspalum notatum var. saurae]|uniref:Uncharacterized protein n=1 Tax=Paspalum notatum var. saurae TaxID=547442 RepID=A0AAQ3X6V1_PASNO
MLPQSGIQTSAKQYHQRKSTSHHSSPLQHRLLALAVAAAEHSTPSTIACPVRTNTPLHPFLLVPRGSMAVVLGALPSLLPKLDELLKGEYSQQKEMKAGIRFIQAELESMTAALEHISKTPVYQLPSQDKIWAKNVRELSYDIEDNIDAFMVQAKGNELDKKHASKKFIDTTLNSLMQPKIRRKNHIIEVHKRRCRYVVNHSVYEPVKVYPHALVRYEDMMTELVGIDEARDEVIKLLMKGNEMSKQHDKIVSIVGFGGLGKTTLANAVYENLRTQFDCSAFVSVSQTPDIDKILKGMFYQLVKYSTLSTNVIDELRELLQEKRYFIIIDDIWEISCWDMIRCALPEGSAEYRIITTTRIFTVAEHIGGSYKMKPLSPENSRILMYGRIFGKEDKDKLLDEQLAELSGRISKKCAGVPLAIITIASLLASKGRNKLEWSDVCNSVGAGLEDSNTSENMIRVLSLSYYDMPSHLRTCFLYLSMFPEDYEIDKDRLIWLWIAEGFIKSRDQEESLFEMGESYLNDLVNRSMIQPIYDTYRIMVGSFHVHDMVLDLIRSLSCEENFVTIGNNIGHSSASEKVRRLSLQNAKTNHDTNKDTMIIEHVRSVVVFPPAIDHVPALQDFHVLLVLGLEDCDLSQGYNLECLGKLLHLRYLGLRDTCIDQLPEEIGNLQLLQTLDVSGNEIYSLPSTIVLLMHLMCLHVDYETRVPKGIQSLTTLEELSWLGIYDDSANIMEELGHLTELKVLEIGSLLAEWNSDWDKSLVECLNKLHKIQRLEINAYSGECNLDGWGVIVAPRHLHTLILRGNFWLSTLPAWVNPSLLPHLSFLIIGVRGLQQEDLEILGRLPALRYLELTVDHEDLGIHGRFTIGACLFPCLLRCGLEGFGGPVVFQQGAMPRLAELWLVIPVQETKEIIGGFELGLGNLSSLRLIKVWFQSRGASKERLEEAKDAVKHATLVHPNHITLDIKDDELWTNEDEGCESVFPKDNPIPNVLEILILLGM